MPHYPDIRTLKAGDVLIADGGFTCLDAGQRCTVEADPDRTGSAALYVACRGPEEKQEPGKIERHYLDGQVDDGFEVIGFTKA